MYKGQVVQLVDHSPCKQKVPGLSPSQVAHLSHPVIQTILLNYFPFIDNGIALLDIKKQWRQS